MFFFIKFLPLLILIVLLIKKKHMLFAGLVSGIVAMIINNTDLTHFNQIFIGSISQMLGITIPILYACIAAVVSKSGSIQAIIELFRSILKGKMGILVAIMVLIQGTSTYMAGLGAGNTMIIAPMVAIAVGVVPEVVAAMAIATAAGVTTSPVSAETALIASSSKVQALSYSASMAPYTIIFFLFAAGLAIYGVNKRGKIINSNTDVELPLNNEKRLELFKQGLPAIVLLIMVVGGAQFNSWIGIKIFNPAVTILVTAILTTICTPFTINQTCEAIIEGSKSILSILFSVGIFLTFISLIGETGVFLQLSSMLTVTPKNIIVPVAMALAFLIAIPSGAMAAGVLSLMLPTLSILSLSPQALGFVAISISLGTQISPVQINVIALSKGFDYSISDIIKCNLKYVLSAFALLVIIAVLVIRI